MNETYVPSTTFVAILGIVTVMVWQMNFTSALAVDSSSASTAVANVYSSMTAEDVVTAEVAGMQAEEAAAAEARYDEGGLPVAQ